MLKKICPYCNNSSYSSSTHGDPWLCPKCLEDITHIPVERHEPCPDPPKNNPGSWFQAIRDYFQKT